MHLPPVVAPGDVSSNATHCHVILEGHLHRQRAKQNDRPNQPGSLGAGRTQALLDSARALFRGPINGFSEPRADPTKETKKYHPENVDGDSTRLKIERGPQLLSV